MARDLPLIIKLLADDKDFQQAVRRATKAAKAIGDAVEDSAKSFRSTGKEASRASKEIRSSFDRVAKSVENVGLTETQVIRKTLRQRLRAIEDARKANIISANEAAGVAAKVVAVSVKKIEAIRDAARAKEARAQKKAADESAARAAETAQKIRNAFNRVRGGVQRVGAAFDFLKSKIVVVGSTIAAAFGARAIINAAATQETAINSVATALARTGEFSQEALKDLEDFASQLQATTGIGDETTLQNIALAQSYGANAEQAKLAAEAAVELSAATGKSLEESIRQISKTFGGYAGELGETSVAVKALTQEQLRNGDAARVLIKEFSGTASAQLQTFSGSLRNVKAAFGDLLEPIGDLIIKNPIVINLFNKLASLFRTFTTRIKNNNKEISKFAKAGLTLALKVAQGFIDAFAIVAKVVGEASIATITFIQTVEEIGLLEGLLEGFRNLVIRIGQGFLFLGNAARGIQSIAANITGDEEALKRLAQEVEDARIEIIKLNDVADTPINLDSAALQTNLDIVKRGIRSTTDSITKFKNDFKEALEAGDVPLEDFIKRFEKLNSLKAKPTIEKPDIPEQIKPEDIFGPSREIFTEITDTAKQTLADLENEFGKSQEAQIADLRRAENEKRAIINDALERDLVDQTRADEALKRLAKETEDQITEIQNKAQEERRKAIESDVLAVARFAQEGVSALTGGADGARKLLSSIGSQVGNLIIPGLGAAVGPIVDALAQGPEAVKAQVQEFARALPDLTVAIAEAIPVLIETLAEEAPNIVLAIADKADEIINALVIALVKSTPIIARSFAVTIPIELAKQAPQIAEAIALGLADSFRQALLDAGPDIAAIAAPFAAVFESVGNRLNAFSDKLAGSQFAERLNAIADRFTAVFGASFENFRRAIEQFGIAVRDVFAGIFTQIGDVFKPIIDFFTEFANSFANLGESIGKAIEEAVKGVGKAVGVGGGGGDVFTSTAKALGFAQGGLVPDGFPGDSFPARLTSGELVIDRSQNAQLQRFLDSTQSSSQQQAPGMSDALLAQILQALQQPQTVTTAIEINGDALADAVLELDRNNQRLAE